jgi:hypothetical protein
MRGNETDNAQRQRSGAIRQVYGRIDRHPPSVCRRLCCAGPSIPSSPRSCDGSCANRWRLGKLRMRLGSASLSAKRLDERACRTSGGCLFTSVPECLDLANELPLHTCSLCGKPSKQVGSKKPQSAGQAANQKRSRHCETSSNECQIRRHRCGTIVLEAAEQHVTPEENDCQQAIHKISTLPQSLIAHFARCPILARL